MLSQGKKGLNYMRGVHSLDDMNQAATAAAKAAEEQEKAQKADSDTKPVVKEDTLRLVFRARHKDDGDETMMMVQWKKDDGPSAENVDHLEFAMTKSVPKGDRGFDRRRVQTAVAARPDIEEEVIEAFITGVYDNPGRTAYSAKTSTHRGICEARDKVERHIKTCKSMNAVGVRPTEADDSKRACESITTAKGYCAAGSGHEALPAETCSPWLRTTCEEGAGSDGKCEWKAVPMCTWTPLDRDVAERKTDHTHDDFKKFLVQAWRQV